MMEYLPRDLWIQIFVRLPAKTILRCLSVCKSWKLFIQHPSFINAHLQHQRQDLLLVRYISEKGIKSDNNLARDEVYSLHVDDESFSMHAYHEFPVLHPTGEHFRVVGSCNGIICISDDQFCICHDTYLWNPTIKKCVALPLPMFTFNKIGDFDHELGFGFDEKTNDYKVVRIMDPRDYDNIIGTPLEVEIYSLSSGVWRKASHLALNLGVRIFGRVFYERDCQVYLNGAVHWIGCDLLGSNFKVIVFLFVEEVFRCLELPTDMTRDYFWMKNLRPVVFQGALSLIQYSEERCGVRVMQDYGASSTWSKRLNINLSGQVQRVIGIRNKGELLIEILWGLYCYDPEAMKEKQFNFLDERDLLDWKKFQEVGEHYVAHYELDETASNMDHQVFVLQNVPNYEAVGHMVEHFYFPEHVLNYDPEAAPKELGIRCKGGYSFMFAFHSERYTESLALIGSINSVVNREEESERKLEEGNRHYFQD